MLPIKDKVYSFQEAKEFMASQIRQLDLLAKPLIYRIEIKIKPIDLISWLEAQDNKVKIYGANQDNTASIAGIGEALREQAGKIDDFAYVFKQLRQYLSPQYPYMQWYGGFCFDENHLDHQWKDFGAYCFVLPRFELASDGKRMIFCCNLIGSLQESVRGAIVQELESIQLNTKPSKNILKSFTRRDLPSKGQWDKNVSTVLEGIQTGKFEKIVLARKTVLKFSKSINPFDILRKLNKVTPNSYHFCFQFEKTAFLGASPERLYKRQGRSILSEAIAGTCARAETPSKDNILKKQLLASIKDNKEHAYVVGAIDQGLETICLEHRQSQKPGILTLGNGHHLITSFEGKLKENVLDEDILKTLHPTPAVGGVPQKQALDLLANLEGFKRGWYTGLIGYLGLDWSEFVVGIRSALVKDKEMTLFAGAGIVEGSEAKSEWQEIEHKIGNFIKIIK